MTDIAPLRNFIRAMTRLADEGASETRWLTEGGALLRDLVADDTWLPDAFAEPGPRYRQYLLHCDPLERFCVVSFVWGPGQRTPVHNHTVWGLVGMLRGEEVSTEMVPARRCAPARWTACARARSSPSAPTPTTSMWSRTRCPTARRSASMSMAAISAPSSRSVFDPETGAQKRFVSGYDNTAVPNLWDRSRDMTGGLNAKGPPRRRGGPDAGVRR